MIRRGLLFAAPLLAAIAALSVYGWLIVPDDAQLPVHWNAEGVADRYGTKAEALLSMPVVALILTGVLVGMASIDPRRDNIQRSPLPFLVGLVGGLGLLTTIHATMILTATGVLSADGSPTRVMLVALAVFLLAVGNVLPKARSNWFVGVRTPWTLSSEYSWDKSQRLGGRLLVAAGVLVLVAALLLPMPAAFATLFLTVAGGAVASIVMSYIWWKRDPARRTGG
jgi:uncharacterized membrane protein